MIDKAVGSRIREARDRKNLSQQQLADAVGSFVKTVSRWENGRVPGESDLAKLAQVLDVSVPWLRYGTELAALAPQTGYGQVTPVGVNILAIVAEEAELLGALERAAELIRHRLKRLHDAR